MKKLMVLMIFLTAFPLLVKADMCSTSPTRYCQYAFNTNGKPYIVGDCGLYFGFKDSNDFTHMCAGSKVADQVLDDNVSIAYMTFQESLPNLFVIDKDEKIADSFIYGVTKNQIYLPLNNDPYFRKIEGFSQEYQLNNPAFENITYYCKEGEEFELDSKTTFKCDAADAGKYYTSLVSNYRDGDGHSCKYTDFSSEFNDGFVSADSWTSTNSVKVSCTGGSCRYYYPTNSDEEEIRELDNSYFRTKIPGSNSYINICPPLPIIKNEELHNWETKQKAYNNLASKYKPSGESPKTTTTYCSYNFEDDNGKYALLITKIKEIDGTYSINHKIESCCKKSSCESVYLEYSNYYGQDAMSGIAAIYNNYYGSNSAKSKYCPKVTLSSGSSQTILKIENPLNGGSFLDESKMEAGTNDFKTPECPTVPTDTPPSNPGNPNDKYGGVEDCGDLDVNRIKACGCIPAGIADITSRIYFILRIVGPLLLLILGGFEMAKAISTQDESAISKAKKKLVNKFIAAAAIFLTLTVIKFIVGIVADNSKALFECIEILLNGYVI